MKFYTYDSIENTECVTEITLADERTIDDFASWEIFFDEMILQKRDKRFHYRIFEWNKLIHMSLTLGFEYRCYAAYTGSRLDGLLSLRKGETLYIDFLSTAPWNYFKTGGRMRRIGSGFVYFTILQSHSLSCRGSFSLFAIEDAEGFCEISGMIPTGRFKFGLKEYTMSPQQAIVFAKKFRRHIIDGQDKHTEICQNSSVNLTCKR